MTERKLINEQDASTFEKAFSNAARLPTPEDRKAAMEKGFRDVIREDLHRDSAYQPPAVSGPRVVGCNGWQNEIPLSAPPGISLIDAMLPALSPQPKPRVNIEALKAFEPSLVRAKLEQALAKGLITREQVDAAMSSLKPEARLGEPKT